MGALGLYLFKSVVWLSGFAIVYFLFPRNERFFQLNRLYLLSGIFASFLFPLVTVRYNVYLPAPGTINAGAPMMEGVKITGKNPWETVWVLSLVLYVSGALAIFLLKLKQSRSVLKSIRKAGIIASRPVKLIRTADYTSSFSFFSYVFINPSLTETETREIVNHELVHISQKHWVDLVLAELLCIIQWFNPMIWIYIRFIRQNHEYLADEVALQSSSDPEVYKATLLNQIVGFPVVSLSNPFNYSLTKKRFLMMKNIITSPYRKMKVLMIVPVFALILYSFATPEYKYKISGNNSGATENTIGQQTKELKGIVSGKNDAPLSGASIILVGTTTGTVTDLKGSFKLTNVPDGAPLIVSYVGYKSKVVKPAYNENMTIQMVRDTITVGRSNIAPPPPPPTSGMKVRSNNDGPPPLVMVDGKETNLDLSVINPAIVESVNVLKDETAVKKYGEKGKNGVIEVTTKKVQMNNTGDSMKEVTVVGYKQEKEMFVAVESLPGFPGGQETMMKWLTQNMKYPQEAVKSNITGNVIVSFVIDYKGKVGNVKTVKPVNPLLDAEAIRLISAMPDWTPGLQGGKPVDVFMKIPINFALK